jgi:alpha-amylase/alpha-mannosidase (GH57 family)
LSTALIIHGHFYQPPRENPWTGFIDDQSSAYPYANWNERIYRECYKPNAYARIYDGTSGEVEDIVNNYEFINFNFGPTLFSWIERYHQRIYQKILQAEKKSLELFSGHSNAIAQVYNHIILPLASERDKRTQIRWGIMDYEYRFNHKPEAMWLSETACNDDTLSCLIDEQLSYVILAPQQAWHVRPLNNSSLPWVDVSNGDIDTGMPYRYFQRNGSGKFIDIFFYNANIAKLIAFDGALASSQSLVSKLLQFKGNGNLVQIATDGESYGHHTKFGDRTLAYALKVEALKAGFYITNYGEFLEKNPPIMEVEIKSGKNEEGTSWSCIHGVDRWKDDCGCHTGGGKNWNQQWRMPLRQALDFLRDYIAQLFESQKGILFQEPWESRDAYMKTLLDARISKEGFILSQAPKKISDVEIIQALTWLEIQRNGMFMYTSCAWFFNDISGIETVQVLKYAERIFDLLECLNIETKKEEFLAMLSLAKSNISEFGNGATIYNRFVQPSKVATQDIVAHLALSRSVINVKSEGEFGDYGYVFSNTRDEIQGKLHLTTGVVEIQSKLTLDRKSYQYAALYLGGVDFHGVVRPTQTMSEFEECMDYIWTKFYTASLPQILRIIQEKFNSHEYGIEHLISGNRTEIFRSIFGILISNFSEKYTQLYEENKRSLEILRTAGFELPVELKAAAEFTLGKKLEKEIQNQDWKKDPHKYKKIIEIADEVSKFGLHLSGAFSTQILKEIINECVILASQYPTEENVEVALKIIRLNQKVGEYLNFYTAQEIIFESIMKNGKVLKLIELANHLGIKVESITAPEIKK